MYMCVCMCMYPCLFILNLMIVIKQWCVHDIKIAAWLLNPEKVPETLADVKQIFPLDQVTDPGDACKVSSKISSLENLENFYSVIKDQLKEQNLFSLFINVEVKLIPVLSVMELRGIKVNKNTFLEEKKILQERIQQVEKEAYKVAGRKFSINSHPQLRQVLFDELKLDSKLQKITLTTVNNLKSTCEAVLEALKDYHPLPQLILEYRHLVKVKSTYVDGLITHIQNGLLCTTWDQTAAVTGRLSSANPNLQAIPKLPVCLTKSENQSGTAKRPEQKVLRIRDPFISQEGWSLLAAGYVCSLLKRRRVLPHLNSMNHVLQMQAERQAINFLIQGSAADICKSAMVEVENEIAAHTNLHARLLVQLHDELLWEVPDIELEATKCLVKKVMEDTGRLLNQQVILEVPITVSLSVGKTWGGMTSLPP
ncbi:DNA polymerase nu-like isoform X4 [Limulus polyphemus]|uniref:DNA polymerase nu-like isoform X4 n=1 Tax=Limulus polyphemus TaxID=6850 RepID=A0ABM1TJB3_LIMPO|nr:DNA polymerase nu-like isoform X4 [Limulus polyphemus]